MSSDEAQATETPKVAYGIKPLPPIPPDHPELRERRIVPPEFARMVEMARRYRANGMQWEE